jgi:NAD(P)H-hydrate repair Nnr-like enzyme with NAD(P)H-hydrate dehydratase domain
MCDTIFCEHFQQIILKSTQSRHTIIDNNISKVIVLVPHHAEIALILELSVENVRKKLYRTRQKLKKELEE